MIDGTKDKRREEMNRFYAVCAVVIIACLVSPSFAIKAHAVSASHKSVASGNTEMAVDLYRELGQRKQGNLFFSPLSISTALAMTYAGAREETAAQMKATLHFELEQSGLNSAYRSPGQKLVTAAQKTDQKLNIANALVFTGGKVSDTYQKILKTYYNAEIFGGDLTAINAWVKRKTEGKIPSILDQLSPNSVCVILNAIYFKGTWDVQFDKDSTRDDVFSTADGRQVTLPLMHRKDNYKLLDEGGTQIISLPYKGKSLSMVVILPKEPQGLAGFEDKLKAADVKDLLVKLDKQPERKVSVYFPRFKMETQYDLGAPLQKMGMKDAFTPRADFTGMGWHRGELFIGQVKHRAFVEVNEEGTEAAAATAVEMVTKSMPPREEVFRADHPFFFMIRDNETGAILFMGRFSDPA
jgi:serpin B